MTEFPRQAPRNVPPQYGETGAEANQRCAANREAYARWHAYWYGSRCLDCGLVRANVVHEQDPENSPEGAAYHAELEHHPFLGGEP